MTCIGRRPARVAFWGMMLAVVFTPAASLLAQAQPAPPTNSTAPADTIGPRELRNFSIGGTRVPAPAPAPPVAAPPSATLRQPSRTPPAAATNTNSVTTVARRPDPARDRPAPPAPDRTPAPDSRRAVPVENGGTIALPSPSARQPEVTASPVEQATPVPRQTSTAVVQPPAITDQRGGRDILPWSLALAVLGLGALAFAFRDRLGLARSTYGQAEDGFMLAPEAPAAHPDPVQTTPPVRQPELATAGGMITVAASPLPKAASPPLPAARPITPSPPVGIVSTRLRPWLEIGFEPSRAVVDEASTSVQFDVVVTNSGSAPARQVLVEAVMINAGPDQDIELARFFDAPVGQGERVEMIPPLGSISLSSAVALPIDQVRAYEVGGRKLFVPLVAFNALYEWSSGKGQSSASFILGRGGSGGEPEPDGSARMAPLRLDLGPRLFRDLAARRHTLGRRV